MSDEEKDILIKAAKSADRELTITLFKLDRTEKVKRTTGILLEETIEELEQKRKAVEEQAKLIQIENERKSLELEEARQLQLAMLPKQLPSLPNMNIAVYMQTATEVGGDYYDFHVEEDGTLTAVIGDATGHGLKAGTIVTITKSLFHSLATNENILETFSKISKVIKDMKFRQLSMCLTMIKIKRK
ncbi:MAG: SpoIIE family protein phosphatase [Ignavibacteriales bacterium]|nr:SpoIIE family protein phosphatase [Ignavibacteriales bacterium]